MNTHTIDLTKIEVGQEVGVYRSAGWNGEHHLGIVLKITKTQCVVQRKDREDLEPTRFSLNHGNELQSMYSAHRRPHLANPEWTKENLKIKEEKLQSNLTRQELDINNRLGRLLKGKHYTTAECILIGAALTALEKKLDK